MCSLVARDRLEPYYKDDESSIGDISISNDATIKTLKSLVTICNFIDIWIKLLCENYCARGELYRNGMEEMFKQIPQNVERAITYLLKKMMTDIGGGWYLKSVLGDYHH